MPQILHEAQARHPDLVIHTAARGRAPLIEPVSRYPWSILWRAADTSDHVRAIVARARAMSHRLGRLRAPEPTAG